jgi:hypothetical protein
LRVDKTQGAIIALVDKRETRIGAANITDQTQASAFSHQFIRTLEKDTGTGFGVIDDRAHVAK